MYVGQVPFRDFGMPLGYGFWLIPFIFFKIFGPYLYSLVIAQAFINFLSLVAFRGILKIFNLSPGQILLSITVMCLSFVMVNFWPWYNHTVFVYELIGLYFLFRYLLRDSKIIWLILAAFFIALTFLTKQDAGGLGMMLTMGILIVDALVTKKFKTLLLYVGFYAVALAVLILPFTAYEFSYWFNFGQSHHFSRINAYDFLSTFFEESLILKLFIIATVIVALVRYPKFKELTADRPYFLFTLFTLGILAQAMIIQVTSFSPATTNFYYNSFAFAFLIYNAGRVMQFEKVWVISLAFLLVLFWRSENYWKYSMKVLGKFLPASFSPPPPSVVSKNTWSSKADQKGGGKPLEWTLTPYRAFKRIKLPVPTVEGIERIKSLSIVKDNPNLKVLNMSNLTPLAHELKYTPEAGENIPLWYHKGVAFFDRESKSLCDKIADQQYDVVLFEAMPDVDNFFPFDVQACLQKHYQKTDSFPSPTGYQTDYIEVYVRPATTVATIAD
ncbi:hypothetical protein DQQ10_10615 [Pseudochryseolinea flava]|uniref:Glycosyltransferase RgtA/B/C/D-like domain-containing protein n=2 Tax=Pseudochryseolinea flava TaxID=2059302 RepID=A0A364Y589_9BACT|nr:hypothetical protein DQQ10_10615 [Pseudochryseolinea flava]